MAAAGATVAAAPAGGETGVVRYRDDRLSVHLADASVAEVLAEISRQSGAQLNGPVPARRVTASFEDLSLAAGLSRLLHGQSFALVYNGAGRLLAIDLVVEAAGDTAVPAPTPPVPPATPILSGEKQAAVFGRTLHVNGELAAALGTHTPTAGQLLHAVLHQASATERTAAQQTLLAAFDADAELENAYLAVLKPVDDATLAKLLHDAAKDRAAEEFMAELATRARSEELRRKAAAVLEQLRVLAAARNEGSPLSP
jgi:hypothetical protein